MKFSVILLACLALAGCAGTTTDDTATTAQATAPSGEEGGTYMANWDGVVQTIDRVDASTGAVGAAAAGSSGYRVTVKKSDGTVETINVDSLPSYRVGDSVRYSSGTLSPHTR